MAKSNSNQSENGFTLVELVMAIVILAVLAATALPKLFNIGSNARIVTVQAFAAGLQTTANNFMELCAVTPNCNLSNDQLLINLNNQKIWLNYGYPDAGDDIGGDEIDTVVDSKGFTVSLLNPYTTFFGLTNAPTPSSCGVQYLQAIYNVRYSPVITTITSGC